MADVFESRPDLLEPRARLFALIETTPHLDWLLLTKRIHLVRKLIPAATKSLPSNVWLGTTVENQEYARKRIPYLLRHDDAAVRFLSCEPLLGPLDLSPFLGKNTSINWVIAGGESGPGARPMHPEWAEGLQEQCASACIAFHFKQWGHWAPEAGLANPPRPSAKVIRIESRESSVALHGVGKSNGGRILLGQQWDELPRNR